MKTNTTSPTAQVLCLLSAIVLALGFTTTALSQGTTAFTYQGRLTDGTNLANGSYDLQFTIYDVAEGGTPVAGPLIILVSGVTNGYFAAALDFGAGVFTGNARWLDLGVRTNGSSAFTILPPRQLITPAPQALYATTATTAATANSVSANNLVGTVPLAQLPSAVVLNNQNGVRLSGTFSGDGSGLSGVVAASTNLMPYNALLTNAMISAPQTLGAFATLSFARNQKPIMSPNFMYYAWYSGTNWFSGTIDTNAYSVGIPYLNATNAIANRPYWKGNIYDDTTEYFVLSAATNAIQTGLAALGYKWIDIGDGWAISGYGQVPRTNGILQADPSKFPHGMPWLFNRLHSMGLKGILWTTLSPMTACGQLGSGGTNLVTDANTFASWGVDCIRFDFDNAWMGTATNDVLKQVAMETFLKALQATNANIVTFMHNNIGNDSTRRVEWGYWNQYYPWIGDTLSHWQTTEPGPYIADSSAWPTTVHWLDVANRWSAQLRKGHTGAPIPVQFGLLLPDWGSGIGYNNAILFISEMALFHSPMCFADNLIACENVAQAWGIPAGKMSNYQTNAYIIAINQDDACNPPTKQFTNGTVEVWTEPLGDHPLWPSGSQALLVVNRGYATNVTATSITIPLTALGFPPNGNTALLTDVWDYTNQVVSGSLIIQAPTNSASLWLVSPTNNTIGGNGSGLTNLNPANLSAGTANINIAGNAATATTAANVTGNIADPQLSANIPRLDGMNSFKGTNNFAGTTIATNANNVLTGTFTGNLIGNATTATTANSLSGSMAGDVTGKADATVVASVGGQTAANVSNGVLAATGATSTNSPSTIVKRDASGNFSAGEITAGSFIGSGMFLTNLSATAITGGLTTNLAVLIPGGGTNTLCFTNGVLRAIQ